MIEREHLDRLPGMNVVGTDDENIGKIDEVYVDDATGEPSFALVNTGLFGMKSSFVPIQAAELRDEDVRVAYDKDMVKDAPNMDPDGHLEPEEEDALYRHYGIGAPHARPDATAGTTGTPGMTETPSTTETLGTGAGAETSATAGTPRSTPDAGAGTGEGTVGRDTSGPTTDDAMTRSEEELDVGTTRRPVGKARLRKHVVTEHVTRTIPVEREEVVVEREPIDASNLDEATDGPAISEEEHEVTLMAEEPVVEKRAVPKERVRLDKETHTEQETVEADVEKEEIDLAGLEDSREDTSR